MKSTKTAYFKSRDEAWDFMRASDDAGLITGFPSLVPDDDGNYSVSYVPREQEAQKDTL